MMRGSRGARAAAIAGGLLAGGALGVSAASAATLPITVTFPGGTVKAGSLPQATATTPTTLAGSINESFAATFPKASVTFADAVATGVALPVGFGTGTVTIKTKAEGDFTGSVPLTFASYDLSGPVSQQIDATSGSSTYTCYVQGSSTLTLSGPIPNLTTGAYSVSGSRVAPLLTTTDPASLPFCTALSASSLLSGASIAHSYAGSIAIPGLVPPPTVVVVPPAQPTPTTPAPAPTPPATATKKPRLKLTLSAAKAVRRGQTASFTLTLANTGTARARSVVIRIARPAGTVLRRTQLKLSSLPAGRTKTVTVRVRTTAKTASRPKVAVTARSTADGLSVSRSRTLKVRG